MSDPGGTEMDSRSGRAEADAQLAGTAMQGVLPNDRAGEPEPASPSNRRGPDRRSERTPRFSKYILGSGRRRKIRRSEEAEGSFVDRYDTSLFFALLWIALMNVSDSFFTLVHLQNGGTEVNPIAAKLLETGRTGFVVWKSAVIGTALLVLCMHKNFALARWGMWTAAAAYTLLVAYHLLLFVW